MVWLSSPGCQTRNSDVYKRQGLYFIEKTQGTSSMLVTVLRKGTVYALIAVSMNMLNGFTGLFSLGQAGFMLVGAYAYAILTIPVAKRAAV